MNSMEKGGHGPSAVLGQKFAYATASLLLGVSCFVQLLGIERALLAILFGWLALRKEPGPALTERRLWAKIGVVLGGACIVIVVTMLIVYFDRVKALIEALEALQ